MNSCLIDMNLGLRNECIIDAPFFSLVCVPVLLYRRLSPCARGTAVHNAPFIPHFSPPLSVSHTSLITLYLGRHPHSPSRYLGHSTPLCPWTSSTSPSLRHLFHTTSNSSSDVHGMVLRPCPGPSQAEIGQAKPGQLTGFARALARPDVQAGHGVDLCLKYSSGFMFAL